MGKSQIRWQAAATSCQRCSLDAEVWSAGPPVGAPWIRQRCYLPGQCCSTASLGSPIPVPEFPNLAFEQATLYDCETEEEDRGIVGDRRIIRATGSLASGSGHTYIAIYRFFPKILGGPRPGLALTQLRQCSAPHQRVATPDPVKGVPRMPCYTSCRGSCGQSSNYLCLLLLLISCFLCNTRTRKLAPCKLLLINSG